MARREPLEWSQQALNEAGRAGGEWMVAEGLHTVPMVQWQVAHWDAFINVVGNRYLERIRAVNDDRLCGKCGREKR